MANHMSEVAKMLGVELGEEFEICANGEATVKLTENGLEIVTILGELIDHANDVCLAKLLTRQFIVKLKPWMPKYDDTYWYIAPDGICHHTCWLDELDDFHFYKLGNCYRSRWEAEANRDKWVAFYASDEVLEV